MKLKAGHMVAERYEIDDIIGSGGMSVVYRAHDKKLDRFVTLKVLKEEYLADENLIVRFPKEARAAAALNHQNIVSIFDHGRDGDILYIVLEYVDGASLKELIVKKAPFDDETNLGVTIQVTEGLSEAHRNGIIHLDIKPQNILITTTSIVKVADFGIARAAKSVTLNAAAGSMGSVHYFSPEQARGGYIDHKSDIYSLGIVMFEMATGKLPFDGENEVSVALQHINDPLPDVLKINPDVSDSVVKIIQKATEKSPSKRYQVIDDMTEDLKRALTDASGSFVDVEPDVADKSPTRSISEENREAVRRQKMRAAFLDGTDPPEEEAFEAFDLGGRNVNDISDDPIPVPNEPPEYQEGQEYGDEEYYDDYYEEYEPPPPPRDKRADRIGIYGGVILGLIVTGIIIFLAFQVHRFFSANMFDAPDIEGLDWAMAEVVARSYGLELVVQRSYYCGNEDCEGDCEGQILQQLTAPGFRLSEGDVLHVVTSLGKPTNGEIMPRLENMRLDYALERLAEIGFSPELDNVELYFFDDETLPRNTVIEQYPLPNIRLNHGDTVTLRIPYGPDDDMVIVPTLVNLSESDALGLLREYSLIANSSQESNDFFPVGQVVRQDPAPGEPVPRNSIVTYVISTGPETPAPTPTPTPEPDEDENNEQNEEPGEPDEPEQPTPPPAEELNLVPDTLTIHLWPVPEDTEYVALVVSRQIGHDHFAIEVNDPNVHVSRFPLTLNVQGAGHTVFRVFSSEAEYLAGTHRFMEERYIR
ncbi:MAG: Stk1 family PASTA domain-containing Ser/Thr kinase [Defluviitaleaceae bacterium]|nr:Stk1 family PASTA domain-containing Ser/Thr kinase [Defluviitaleaceae bacterium]